MGCHGRDTLEPTMPNIDDLYEGEMDVDSLMQCGHHHMLNHIMAKAMAKPKEGIPYQYRDILKYPLQEQEKWNKACRDEIASIEERNVWSLVDCPPDRKPVTADSKTIDRFLLCSPLFLVYLSLRVE